MNRRVRERQGEDEFAALAQAGTLPADRAAMRFDQILDQRQSEPESVTVPRFVHLRERLEQLPEAIRLETDPSVPNRHGRLRRFAPNRHGNRPVLGVGHRISEEVVEDLRESFRVGVDVRRLCREVVLDP